MAKCMTKLLYTSVQRKSKEADMIQSNRTGTCILAKTQVRTLESR